MAKNFRHEGKTRNFVAAEDVVSGQVVSVGGSKVGVVIADTKVNETGVAYICGVWRISALGHGLSQGADVLMTLATQVVGTGVSIGEVDEVPDANNIDVLINGLPGTASNR